MKNTTSISQNNSPYTLQSTIDRGASISFFVDEKNFDNYVSNQKKNLKVRDDQKKNIKYLNFVKKSCD